MRAEVVAVVTPSAERLARMGKVLEDLFVEELVVYKVVSLQIREICAEYTPSSSHCRLMKPISTSPRI